MNESPDISTLQSDHYAPVARARASLVLRYDGGSLVAPLSRTRPITVGRRLPADVIINDQSLALQHARFSWAPGGLSVEDLGSRSGTWVGGEAVKSAELHPGQSVRLGNVTATIHLGVASDPTVRGFAPASAATRSPRMQSFVELLRQVAQSSLCALIVGEPGSGKRFAAAMLHAESPHASLPAAQVECGRGAEADGTAFGEMMQSNGNGAEPALLQRARGGVLVLHDVASLSAADQALLAKHMVCEPDAVTAPLRVIATDERELGELVAVGQFRSDLYERLSACTLRLPALRERPEDIEPLVALFLTQVAEGWGRPVRQIDDRALAKLREFSWPGNVEQLRQVIEHADLVCSSGRIEVSDLPREVLQQSLPVAVHAPSAQQGGVVPPSEAEASRAGLDFKGRIREYEVRMIIDALKRTGGNQRATARLLRIPLRTLAHKMKAYSIKRRLAFEIAQQNGVSA